MKQKQSRTSELFLDELLPDTLMAKLYLLCKKRKLIFPEGIVYLMQEVLVDSVSSPRQNHSPAKQDRDGKKAVKQETQNGKPAVKQGRANNTVHDEKKQGRAKAQPKPSPRSRMKK